MNPELPRVNDDIARLLYPISYLLVQRDFASFTSRNLLPLVRSAARRSLKPAVVDEGTSEAWLFGHGYRVVALAAAAGGGATSGSVGAVGPLGAVGPVEAEPGARFGLSNATGADWASGSTTV